MSKLTVEEILELLVLSNDPDAQYDICELLVSKGYLGSDLGYSPTEKGKKYLETLNCVIVVENGVPRLVEAEQEWFLSVVI